MKAEAQSRRKIMVVEDDRAIRDLLRVHLENAGYEVAAVPDAVVAGKQLLADPASVHLLIVDANLPFMGGIEFASTLIADSSLPFIPMVLITGYTDFADRADRLGVPCLIKPFTTDALIQIVAHNLASTPVQSAAGLRERGVARLVHEYGKGRA